MTLPQPAPSVDLSAHALNLVNCGVICLDASACIVAWNSWMVPRSGQSVARVLGNSLFAVFPQLRGSRVEAAVTAALANGRGTNIASAQGSAPFPLVEAGRLDGAHIDQAVSVTPFNQAKARFCMIEIRDVSGVFERERRLLDHAESLRARSYVDGLTGIANRRYFDVALERELRRAQRLGTELSLLLMDIDTFKAYNDHFGHLRGDACLTAVAQALAGMLKRPADVAARYGGEEFAAILPDTPAAQACLHADAIRRRVAALAIAAAPAGARPHVTLSIGVASFDKARRNTAAALIDAADSALYAAKRGGRDRVMADGAPTPAGAATQQPEQAVCYFMSSGSPGLLQENL